MAMSAAPGKLDRLIDKLNEEFLAASSACQSMSYFDRMKATAEKEFDPSTIDVAELTKVGSEFNVDDPVNHARVIAVMQRCQALAGVFGKKARAANGPVRAAQRERNVLFALANTVEILRARYVAILEDMDGDSRKIMELLDSSTGGSTGSLPFDILGAFDGNEEEWLGALEPIVKLLKVHVELVSDCLAAWLPGCLAA
jgi:hypothetical protein